MNGMRSLTLTNEVQTAAHQMGGSVMLTGQWLTTTIQLYLI